MMRRSAAGAALVGLLLSLVTAVGVASPAQARAKHPNLHDNGSHVGYTVHGKGRVRIDARAAYCEGFARLRVWVDGKLDSTIKLSRRSTKRYLSQRAYANGKHRVVLVLRRDKKVSRGGDVVCDRRTRIMRVSMATSLKKRDRDGVFSIAVIGDTQNEVMGGRTTFAQRTRWLANHAASEDLRFVAHTGDITSFGWVAPQQYTVARKAMATLTKAGIGWQVTAGNHDTQAVGWDGSGGYGGDAYAKNPECRVKKGSQCDSNLLLRQTGEFRTGLPDNPHSTGKTGYYQRRPDNSWVSFQAGGRQWLVLNLELWPRPAVVEWARKVVAARPKHNVIVQTHDYLSQSGTVNGHDGGYGDTSGQYLEQRLIGAFPNVKLVLSGHQGLATSRVFGYGGNKVVAYLGNEGSTAVTRLIEIDVRRGTVSSRFWTDTANLSSAPAGTTRATGLTFR